ncbi:hypothetical protein DN601_04595 [Klebsiella quasipneumoniae subsp. similipneumoniae]|nr:hypothetical protein DN601_04595 [Klebsiella quasipneumoniae subsp. similipneumoniae]
MTQSRRPAQAQRRRARTADAEPLLCRVAANALPDLRLRAICQPGSTLERRLPRRETWRRKNISSVIHAEFTAKKTPVTPDATGVFSLLSFPLNGVRGSQSSSCGSSARRRHETR